MTTFSCLRHQTTLATLRARKPIPAGSFVVDTAQPYGRMATALLETETPEDSEFLKRQETLRKANEAKGTEEAKQDYEFYDVTAWSLPLAMGVEAYSTDEPIRGDVSAVSSASQNLAADNAKNNGSKDLAASQRRDPESPMRLSHPPYRPCEWRFSFCARDIAWTPRMIRFAPEDKDMPRGTFILWAERNPNNLPEILTDLSEKNGVPVQSIHSSFPDSNRRGIGSETDFFLKAPKVAILAGRPRRADQLRSAPFPFGAKMRVGGRSGFVGKSDSGCP